MNAALHRWCRKGVRTRLSRGGRDALLGEHLDEVADLDVVEPLEPDPALEAGLDLAHVILEAPERSDLALVDDDVVPQQPRLRVAGARDAALADHAAGDRAELWDLEGVADLGDPHPHFLEGRIEQGRHGVLYLAGPVVN